MVSFIIGFIQGFTITTTIITVGLMVYYLFLKDKKKTEKKEEPKAKPSPKSVGYKRMPTNIKTVKDLKDYLNNRSDDELMVNLIKIEHEEYEDSYTVDDISITLQGKGKILITIKD